MLYNGSYIGWLLILGGALFSIALFGFVLKGIIRGRQDYNLLIHGTGEKTLPGLLSSSIDKTVSFPSPKGQDWGIVTREIKIDMGLVKLPPGTRYTPCGDYTTSRYRQRHSFAGESLGLVKYEYIVGNFLPKHNGSIDKDAGIGTPLTLQNKKKSDGPLGHGITSFPKLSELEIEACWGMRERSRLGGRARHDRYWEAILRSHCIQDTSKSNKQPIQQHDPARRRRITRWYR